MAPYCESAVGFSNDVCYQDEGYFDALVHMFEQALKVTRQLPADDCDALACFILEHVASVVF